MVAKKVSKRDKDVLKRHSYLLKTISSVGKKRRDTVLSNAPPSLFPAIRMLAKHLVKGTIQLTNKDRKKLTQPMKKILRQVHATKAPKKTIIQHGDGISKILRFILPVVASIISAI